MPRAIGNQDVGAFLAHQPDETQRARVHMLASPLASVRVATLSLPRPLGTSIPELPSFKVASLSYANPDFAPATRAPQYFYSDYPTVNRALKGDLLIAREHNAPESGGSRDLTPGRVKTVSFPRPSDTRTSPSIDLTPDDLALKPEEPSAVETPSSAASATRAHVFDLGDMPIGGVAGPIERWPMDQTTAPETRPLRDPDFKRLAALTTERDSRETVAPKGEVTGPGRRPKTPAERLGLDFKQRTKAEKCLAEAIYFESRGESRRGQVAVAQVVMNRVFSGYYPESVCGVVYQNSHRKLACQFSFACDGIPNRIEQPDMWEQARTIARDMLDGKLWLPDIGHSTHYHAYWVHPAWVREMKRMHKVGVHSFYRPRAWGDGSEVPPLNGTVKKL